MKRLSKALSATLGKAMGPPSAAWLPCYLDISSISYPRFLAASCLRVPRSVPYLAELIPRSLAAVSVSTSSRRYHVISFTFAPP